MVTQGLSVVTLDTSMGALLGNEHARAGSVVVVMKAAVVVTRLPHPRSLCRSPSFINKKNSSSSAHVL